MNRVATMLRHVAGAAADGLDDDSQALQLERRLQELFFHVSSLDDAAVVAEEKARAKRDKETNRIRTKQEQASILALRKMDQDRRARLPLKRKMGKPLMRRSDPHTKKQTRIDSDAEKQQDAEMYQYFFD